MALRLLSAAALTVALSTLVSGQSLSMNPCHGNKGDQAAPACGKVTMPSGFCRACRLLPPRDDGNFVNCKKIYNLDAPGCKEMFEEYVEANPCDTRRKELVGTWNDWSKERLDYFAYSLCELNCDLIEAGSKAWEFDTREKEGRLWSLGRGNGPAHFHFDVCAIFPNFRFWDLGCDHWDRPKVCPMLKAWHDGPSSQGWPTSTNVQMAPEIRTAIEDGLYALEADEKETWLQCLNLEATQGRVR